MIPDPYNPIREFLAGECFESFTTYLDEFLAEMSPNHPSYGHFKGIQNIILNVKNSTPAPIPAPEEDNSGEESAEPAS